MYSDTVSVGLQFLYIKAHLLHLHLQTIEEVRESEIITQRMSCGLEECDIDVFMRMLNVESQKLFLEKRKPHFRWCAFNKFL